MPILWGYCTKLFAEENNHNQFEISNDVFQELLRRE